MRRQSSRTSFSRKIAALVFPSLVLFAAGCKPDPPARVSVGELNTQQLRGREIFESRCVDCHDATSNRGPHGPGLLALYRKKYLPSGAPANDDRVRATILQGRGMMPAFGNNLEEQQLNDLLVYLHTL